MNTISKLEASDLSTAFEIEKLSHLFPWTEKTFLSNQGERYLNLKIMQKNQIVGFCIVQMVLDEATLFNIAIHPQFQRQGLAKQLLNYLLDQLMLKKINTVWLEVRKSNQAAIALYNQLGFNEISVRANYYPSINNQREDAIIMANTLTFN